MCNVWAVASAVFVDIGCGKFARIRGFEVRANAHTHFSNIRRGKSSERKYKRPRSPKKTRAPEELASHQAL